MRRFAMPCVIILVLPEDVEFWVRVVNDEAPAVIDNSALTVIKETGGEFMRRQ